MGAEGGSAAACKEEKGVQWLVITLLPLGCPLLIYSISGIGP